MSMIHDGLVWKHGMQTNHLSDPITVKRGGASVVVSAMVADVQDNPLQLSGVVTGEWRRHYIIPYDEYIFGGVETKPDEADEFIDGYGDTYTVSRDSTGIFWRYADETNLAFRIYTSMYEDV